MHKKFNIFLVNENATSLFHSIISLDNFKRIFLILNELLKTIFKIFGLEYQLFSIAFEYVTFSFLRGNDTSQKSYFSKHIFENYSNK